MHRVVLYLPGLVAPIGGESVLRQPLQNLERLTENGEIFRLAPLPDVETPEAFVLGLGPEEAQMAPGPLTIAGLGVDPPDDSTQFHLSLASLCEDTVSLAEALPSESERKVIRTVLPRLNTRFLTSVEGDGLDHGLVLEKRGDFATAEPKPAIPYSASLPNGDYENLLRRFIDDSVNLLDEMEFNLVRREEGMPPLNVLWPWGPGRRVAVPNLLLRRGIPALVQSPSLRLAGLSRLAGYRHSVRSQVGSGVKTNFSFLAERACREIHSITVLAGAEHLRQNGQWEELEWFAKEMDRQLLGPLIKSSNLPFEILFLSNGIGVRYVSDQPRTNSIPLDERALEEGRLPLWDLWSTVASALD